MNKTWLTAITLAAAGFAATTASAQEWAGPYIGGSISSTKISSHDKALTFDTNLDGQFGDTVKTTGGADYFAPGFCKGMAQGTTPSAGCRKKDGQGGLGLRGGYDWQTGPYLYGLVAEYSLGKITDGVSGFSSRPDSYTFTREIRSVMAIRGRAGYVYANWLGYVTAGPAWGDTKRSFATTNGLNTFAASGGKDAMGYQAGLGVERRIAGGHWSVGLEYLHTSLKDKAPIVRAGPSSSTFASNPFLTGNAMGTDIRRSDQRFRADAITLSLTYRFR